MLNKSTSLPIRSSLSLELIKYRQTYHLSQTQMARKLAINVKAYQSYEERRAIPRLSKLHEICEMIGVELSKLIKK